MKVSKTNFAKALSEYLVNILSKDIGDTSVKMVIIAAGRLIDKKPSVIESIFDNPIVISAMDIDGEMVSVDIIKEVISDVIDESGSLPLEFPKIPFIAPNGATIKMTKSDFDRLFECMNKYSV